MGALCHLAFADMPPGPFTIFLFGFWPRADVSLPADFRFLIAQLTLPRKEHTVDAQY